MHNANLYEQNNSVQKRDAFAYLEKYAPKMRWKRRDNMIIDLGCGDGTVTSMLKKYLPMDHKLLGIDLSENMVHFANDHHANENTSFTVLDIAGDLPYGFNGKFNHVFSFYTLHWIQNQKKAFENIFNLLEQDGQCFLIFLASNIIYDAFRALSRLSKWSLYLQDIESFVCRYHDLKEPDKEVTELMEKIGFIDIEVECNKHEYLFSNLDDLKNHLKTINPFEIPRSKSDEFFNDCIQMLQANEVNQNDRPNTCTIHYKLLVVYGRKPDRYKTGRS